MLIGTNVINMAMMIQGHRNDVTDMDIVEFVDTK